MPKKLNYYETLGVSPTATLEDIRKAYYRLARQYHPDVNPEEQAGETFKEITRIYKILSDRIRRREYDRELAKESPKESPKEPESPQSNTNSPEEQAWEFYQAGLKKIQKLNYQGAIADYTQALELNPQLVEAYYQRGFARSQVNNNREAFADYTTALAQNPQLPEIYYYRGLTRFKLGNIPGSLEDFDRALKINPHYGEAFYQRGLVYQEIDDKPAAIENFQQALKEFSRQGDRFNHNRTMKALENIPQRFNFFEKMPPLLTFPREMFKTWRGFALNPMEGLFPTFVTLENPRAIAIGFCLIFNLCFTIGVGYGQNFYLLSNRPIFTLIIIGFLPVFTLTTTSGFIRLICQAKGSFTGDFFIASASLFPLGLWILLAGLIQNWVAFSILGIFAISYTILTIYSGCQEISHMSATQSSLTVPIILLLGLSPLLLII